MQRRSRRPRRMNKHRLYNSFQTHADSAHRKLVSFEFVCQRWISVHLRRASLGDLKSPTQAATNIISSNYLPLNESEPESQRGSKHNVWSVVSKTCWHRLNAAPNTKTHEQSVRTAARYKWLSLIVSNLNWINSCLVVACVCLEGLASFHNVVNTTQRYSKLDTGPTIDYLNIYLIAIIRKLNQRGDIFSSFHCSYHVIWDKYACF